jgi:hypothetical protein
MKPWQPVAGEIASREHLFVLDAILERSRAPKIRDDLQNARAVYCVRRSLEVAILSAEMAKHDREQGEAIGGWATQRNRADRAAKAVRYLLEWLGGSAPDAATVARAIGRARLGRTDVDVAIWDSARAGKTTPELRDAETLIAAAALLNQFRDDTERRRKGFAAKRQNPGEPEKLAFVLQLGRGWTFLVGKTPSAGALSPFAEFVGAAWRDWTGEISDKPEFFTQAIRAAGPVVKQERWQLTTRGPTWL